ncbi:MAG: hypothetical protein V8T62_04135 [Oscillospiraceae bacterium]
MFAFWPVFAVILPECGEEAEDWKKLSGCLERASTNLVIRIAVLLSQSTDVPAVLSRLRLRKKLSAEVQMLLQWKENLSLPLRVSMKYLLRDLGQQNARRWIDYRFALEGEADCRQKRMELLERILTDEECFLLSSWQSMVRIWRVWVSQGLSWEHAYILCWIRLLWEKQKIHLQP